MSRRVGPNHPNLTSMDRQASYSSLPQQPVPQSQLVINVDSGSDKDPDNLQVLRHVPATHKTPVRKRESIIVEDQPRESSREEEFSVESNEDCDGAIERLRKTIIVLVKNADKQDEKLEEERQKVVEGDKEMGEIFDTLLKKFRRLKKTKEEMTKYCMRKAFKFLVDKYRRSVDAKDTTEFLREYFDNINNDSFSIPFKKNSEEKTMNTNFLKKVFRNGTFLADYKQFLKSFERLIEDDNSKKIKYLATTVKTYQDSGSLKKLETVKRMPWTQSILDKTKDLAFRLIVHSPTGYKDREEAEGSSNAPASQRESSSYEADEVASEQIRVIKRRFVDYPSVSLSPPKTTERAFCRGE